MKKLVWELTLSTNSCDSSYIMCACLKQKHRDPITSFRNDMVYN